MVHLGRYTNTCVQLPVSEFPGISSPAGELASLRAGGIVPDVQEKKDDSGNLVAVIIVATLNGTPTSLYFFTSMDVCQFIVSAAQADGSVPDMNDLK
jgi:hypothetical protein